MLIARPRLAVIVPVYGNERSLPELHQRILAAAEKARVELTLVYVNDRSPDDSQRVLEELAAGDDRVQALLLSRNHGSFVAICAGLTQVADHDAMVIIAADLQDPPELLPEMVDAWRQGKKVVLCTRRNRDDPPLSVLFSQAFHWLFRRIAIRDMPKGGFDFCLIDKAVTRVILESAEKKTSLVGLILWAGFDRAHIQFDRAKRKHGHSMWSFKRKLSYAFHSIVAFSSAPLQFFALSGLALSVVSLLGIVYILVVNLLGIVDVKGWSSSMLMQLFNLTMSCLGFGILGGYLWNNLEQTRKRPLFIVEKRLGGGRPASVNGAEDVAFFDIRAVNAPVLREMRHACHRTLDAAQVVLGPRLARFEREFAAWVGARHVVGVANGTDAITLALWAAGLGAGERVAVPAISAPPTAVAVLRAGCVPVFVDVEPAGLTLCPRALEAAMLAVGDIKAVVPVHLYGGLCDMAAIAATATRLGAVIVEDCAQSTGSTFQGRHCGLEGLAGAFSFYPTKNLGCIGDGGAVVANDDAVAERLRRMRFYGQNAAGECVEIGMNSRLDEIQAALLSERLRVLDEQNEERRKLAALYDSRLQALHPTAATPGRTPHLYVIRPEDRNGLRSYLTSKGVGTGVHYGIPLHRHAFLAARGVATPCPVAEAACARVVSLPCHPGLSLPAARRVADACLEWLERPDSRPGSAMG